MLQAMFTGIGGWLGYFLGGCDGLLYALIAFTVIDYISGVMCGIVDNNLSSSIGFKGICRKVIVFMLVGVATILDTRIFQTISDRERTQNCGNFLLHLKRRHQSS